MINPSQFSTEPSSPEPPSPEPSCPEMDPSPFFAGRTGRGLRVAVIDSGVNPRHPHITGVSRGVSILGPDELEEGCFTDVLGHGTAVMAAIQERAPDAEYFAVKLFNNSLRTTTPSLLAAINWAIAKRVDVVNLSLGTLNFDYKNQFQEAVERAAAHGIILVSAREADGKACLPGVLPGVIGVGLDWDCPRNRFRVAHDEGGVHYFASGYPRSLPGMPKERNLRGISFAVANMTGLVLRARQSCSAQQIHEALAAECAVASEPPVQTAEP